MGGNGAKHGADVRVLGADHKRQSRTPQKTQEPGRGRVRTPNVFEGAKKERARTCRGYAQIAEDARAASTGLQGFKYQYRRGRKGFVDAEGGLLTQRGGRQGA